MRSWWFKALVIVAGLVARPGDAWAGRVSDTHVRGLEWGTKCSTQPGFVRKYREIEKDILYSPGGYYARPGETLTFGSVPVKSVWYTCEDDRLTSVQILFESRYSPAIWAECASRYGGRHKDRCFTDKPNSLRQWTSPLTLVDVYWINTSDKYHKLSFLYKDPYDLYYPGVPFSEVERYRECMASFEIKDDLCNDECYLSEGAKIAEATNAPTHRCAHWLAKREKDCGLPTKAP